MTRDQLKPGDWIEVRDPNKRVMYGDGLFKVVKVGRVNVLASIDVRFSPTGPWYHQEHTIPLSHVVRVIPPNELAPEVSEARRYPKPPAPPRRFVAPRVAGYSERDANIEVFFPDERFARSQQGWVGITIRAPLIAQGPFADGYHMLWGPIRTSEYRTIEGRIYAKLGNAVQVSLVERQRTTIDDMREPHLVADFNTIDDLLHHERDQNGATHVFRSRGSVRIYYPNRNDKLNPYKEGIAWQENGYWHAQAPSERISVVGPVGGLRTDRIKPTR